MIVRDVMNAYRTAVSHIVPLLSAHLFIRLVVTSLLVPVIGLALAATLRFSDQTALTDQDIAAFLLTPAGSIGALVIASLLIVALVLDVVIATAILRHAPEGPLATLRFAATALVRSVPRLVPFVAHFLFRLLVLVLPFALLAGGIAYLLLTEFDINYYLTERPLSFYVAVLLIGCVLLALAFVLIARLSAWAISLHLCLLDEVAPRQAFYESSIDMTDHRVGLIKRLLFWVLARTALAAAAGAIAAFAVSWLSDSQVQNLEAMALAVLVGTGVYIVAMALINALSNGALAALLNAEFDRALAGDAPKNDVDDWEKPGESRLKPRLIIGAALGVAAIGLITGGLLSEQYAKDTTAQVIAHRGAAALAPENSMAAVQRALDDGADWIEIDVQESADGEVIVAHDSDFMKAAGVPTKVWDVTADELASIDIGSWFDPSFSGERVPRLSEVLEIVRDKANLLIELKYYGHDEDLEARVAALVEEAGMSDQVATMSLKYPAVQKMRALRPDWRAGVLAATSVGNLSGLDGDFLALNQAHITPATVKRAEDAGKDVYAWTVNAPMSMTRMLWTGVDGLITDDPALAREVIESYGALSIIERMVLSLSDRINLTLEPANFTALRP